MVTNRKLYDYYQRWTVSVHSQEDVTCVDCHDLAAGGVVPGEARSNHPDNATGPYNIPRTCGECHEEIYEGFRESTHFDHVVAKQQEEQGPTCVTCHGSINVSVLNVVTVEEACARCHNEESGNHPENPAEARSLRTIWSPS